MDGIKLRSHLERLTNKVIKKSPKKKLNMDTDNKKTRRMVMQEHSEDLLKKENKRWLSKSKLKKEAVKKAEETMAEICSNINVLSIKCMLIPFKVMSL